MPHRCGAARVLKATKPTGAKSTKKKRKMAPERPRMTRSASMLANVRCVLCGDLGGTNSRLELFRLQHTASKKDLEAIGTEPPLYAQTYKTNNLPGDFTELLHAFLAEANVGLVELAAGCLAVAGPVEEGDRVTFTNLGWRIEARLLEAEFRMQPGTMRLVNDFVANGTIAASRRVGVFSLHSHESSPGVMDVGGLFFDFDAPRRLWRRDAAGGRLFYLEWSGGTVTRGAHRLCGGGHWFG